MLQLEGNCMEKYDEHQFNAFAFKIMHNCLGYLSTQRLLKYGLLNLHRLLPFLSSVC